MPSTPSLPSPASAMAFLMASTAIARVLRFELRLYSVSPTPTMQYLSLSDPMRSPCGSSGRTFGPFECIPSRSTRSSRRRGMRRWPGEREEKQRESVERRAQPERRHVRPAPIEDPSGGQWTQRGRGTGDGEERANEAAGPRAPEEVGYHRREHDRDDAVGQAEQNGADVERPECPSRGENGEGRGLNDEAGRQG